MCVGGNIVVGTIQLFPTQQSPISLYILLEKLPNKPKYNTKNK